ncbi:MAG: polyprenol monophosphomannose synthase [Cytophagaceae bacterium]|nr:polyprenol monophosphomannose synthase [Cytophagaceae bacterium]MDW8455829.1 polyprenol monophosphomannose synthase [Cytophagaceae bacterium]
MQKTLVIIPTYNERDNIENIIRKVFSLELPFHILIIDDGSPDGTASIVKELQKEFSGRLFLEERPGKMGLGTAYIHGFKYALKNDYVYICEMDADFSHNPDDLIRLYDACENQGADLAIGSRYVNGVTVINWPIERVLMSYFASRYVKFITGIPINDTTAGFKCYRHTVLRTINLDAIKFVGYAFQIQMKFEAWKYGFKIIEVPIIFTDRKLGVSKMSSGIFKEAFFGVLQMKIKSLFKHYNR